MTQKILKTLIEDISTENIRFLLEGHFYIAYDTHSKALLILLQFMKFIYPDEGIFYFDLGLLIVLISDLFTLN